MRNQGMSTAHANVVRKQAVDCSGEWVGDFAAGGAKRTLARAYSSDGDGPNCGTERRIKYAHSTFSTHTVLRPASIENVKLRSSLRV